jgi:hypothetical protein
LIPNYHYLSWLRGVPAAIVTVAASFLGSFSYKEDAVRQGVTRNALWNELAKYLGHAAPYNKAEPEDTSVFLNNVALIVDSELNSWSTLVRGDRADGQKPPPKTANAKGPRL